MLRFRSFLNFGAFEILVLLALPSPPRSRYSIFGHNFLRLLVGLDRRFGAGPLALEQLLLSVRMLRVARLCVSFLRPRLNLLFLTQLGEGRVDDCLRFPLAGAGVRFLIGVSNIGPTLLA